MRKALMQPYTTFPPIARAYPSMPLPTMCLEICCVSYWETAYLNSWIWDLPSSHWHISMGTRMAPPHADLFMGLLEHAIQTHFGPLISFWKRFIDDIFFIFQGSETKLNEMFAHMHSTHPTIKFIFEYSKSHILFLDTVAYVDSNHRQLQTTIHRKPTDRTCLLHFSSHHPRHVKDSIIYTQALRYCAIISNDQNLETELHTLCEVLLARGYPLKLICQQFQKALLHPRHTLIQPKPQVIKQNEVTPIVAPYNP